MPRHALAAASLLLFSLAGCATWHVEKGASPVLLLATEHPKAIRVIRANRSQVVIENPQVVEGDSIAGVFRRKRSSVAIADIRQVATLKSSTGSSIGLAVGLSVIGALIFISSTAESGSIFSCGC